jgi:hypothetical protein
MKIISPNQENRHHHEVGNDEGKKLTMGRNLNRRKMMNSIPSDQGRKRSAQIQMMNLKMKSRNLNLKRVHPSNTELIVVDEEKAEANKKRFAALEMLKEIEEEFAKLRDRYKSHGRWLIVVFLRNVQLKSLMNKIS